MLDFSVTGWGFIAPLLILTVVVFLVSVSVPPRLKPVGLVRYLVQAVSLVLVSTLVLLSVAALMNRQNNWYTTWDDLFSGSAATAQVSSAGYGRLAASAAHAKQPQQTATSLQANPLKNPDFGAKLNPNAEGGQYVSFKYKGENAGQTYGMMIWLPASYLKDPQRFYPVIMGFTGFPGSPKTYSTSVDYGGMIQNAVDHHAMREAIFVVPDVSPGSYDSECVDGDNAPVRKTPPKAETYVVHDVVPWLRENLRTIDSPRAWATEGYSAGGWCSAMFSMKHPDIFGSAMIQSGYFSPIYTRGQEWNKDNTRYDLARIAQDDAPAVNLYYFSSTDDSLSWSAAKKFIPAVRAPTSLSVNTIPVGGHRLAVWLPGMSRGLEWLGHTSPLFAATAR